MSRGASMDAISLDDWELLPNHMSSFFMEECTTGHGTVGDEEAKKQVLPPLHGDCSQDAAIEFRDIDVVQTESKRGDSIPKVAETLISDAEEDEEIIGCSDGAKEVCEDEGLVEAEPDLCAEEEEDVKTGRSGLECIGFGVGKLRVNGVRALCSFGVAAATFCIILLGGRQQNKQHNHKTQLQMYADDERIQQVVQQASRLNQAMSSVIGGPSTRASISFGGYYDGF